VADDQRDEERVRPVDERLALINTVIKPGSASAMAPPVTTRPAARQSVVAGHDGRFRDARHDGFGLPASDLWSIAQPLDLDDEHELIGRVDQKGHESFVAIAEVQGAKWLGRVSRLANVMLVFKGIDDDRSVHQLGQGYPDFY
jgi:hypothetical protein